MQYNLKIKSIRKSKGITQKQLAEYLSVSQSVISDYESFKSDPSLYRLIQISLFLSVELNELVEVIK